MELLKLLLFIPACFALNMTPGPNNLLSLNNARCYGFYSAFIAGLGRVLAFAGMIAWLLQVWLLCCMHQKLYSW